MCTCFLSVGLFEWCNSMGPWFEGLSESHTWFLGGYILSNSVLVWLCLYFFNSRTGMFNFYAVSLSMVAIPTVLRPWSCCLWSYNRSVTRLIDWLLSRRQGFHSRGKVSATNTLPVGLGDHPPSPAICSWGIKELEYETYYCTIWCWG